MLSLDLLRPFSQPCNVHLVRILLSNFDYFGLSSLFSHLVFITFDFDTRMDTTACCEKWLGPKKFKLHNSKAVPNIYPTSRYLYVYYDHYMLAIRRGRSYKHPFCS